VLLAIFVVIAVAVPLVGFSVPFCSGDASGHIGAACLAKWEAGRPLFPDRLVALVGPIPAAVMTFLTLTGVSLLILLARRRRRGPSSRDIERR
jgi:hypothetical protein